MPNRNSKENVESLPYALAMIRATLEATADAILAIEKGRITSWNTKFVSMWGMPLEVVGLRDVQKVSAFIALQLKDSERYLARLAEIEASKEKSFDLLELADGRFIERYSEVISVEERVIGRVWSFRDVTQRYESDLIPRRLAAIVDSSEDAIIGKDLTSIITIARPNFSLKSTIQNNVSMSDIYDIFFQLSQTRLVRCLGGFKKTQKRIKVR